MELAIVGERKELYHALCIFVILALPPILAVTSTGSYGYDYLV
jgi:nitrate reductase NapE component